MNARDAPAGAAPLRPRRATEQDIPGVVDCLQAAFAPYRSQYTPAAYADTVPSPATVGERLRTMSVWVVETPPGIIVGTLAGARRTAEEGHLRGMAVRPERQGTGIAGALLVGALQHLRSLGCRRVTLDTTPPLGRARRFYERNGFRRSGTVTDYFGMPLVEYAFELGGAPPPR